MTLILILAVSSAVASVALAATHVLSPRRDVRGALARVSAYGVVAADGPEPQRPRRSLLEPFARVAVRFAPSKSLAALELRLAAAGIARTVTPAGFFAGKIAAAAAGLLVGLMLAAGGSGPVRGIVLAAVLALLSYRVPDVLLSSRVHRRRESILEELPNALDLLAVSVEAGLGLDAAIARLVEATKGPLADEFALLLAELRVGAARHDVLRRFAERVPSAETAAFVRAVIHADKLGTSLSQTLRVGAGEARLKRQAVAEEKAGKAPVRMLFPTVFFIFPPIFVVVLGPALLYLTTQI